MTYQDNGEVRDEILLAALPHVPFDGWGETAIVRGAADAGYDAATARRLFPGGAAEMIACHSRYADRSMMAALATRLLYRTVDAMWYAAGDTSTDYNFYSKRALLAGVYAATLLCWLNDNSDGFSATWAFLDRRIAEVLRAPKAMARANRILERLPDPFRLLRTTRSS
jgi:ubiquinone biosynthesis protein COQ9